MNQTETRIYSSRDEGEILEKLHVTDVRVGRGIKLEKDTAFELWIKPCAEGGHAVGIKIIPPEETQKTGRNVEFDYAFPETLIPHGPAVEVRSFFEAADPLELLYDLVASLVTPRATLEIKRRSPEEGGYELWLKIGTWQTRAVCPSLYGE